MFIDITSGGLEYWDGIAKMIGSFRYSTDEDGTMISYDERLGVTRKTARQKTEGLPFIEAEDFISVIGEEAFKAYLRNTWGDTYGNVSPRLGIITKVSNILLYGFTWSRSPEGHEYWDTLCRELKRYEDNLVGG